MLDLILADCLGGGLLRWIVYSALRAAFFLNWRSLTWEYPGTGTIAWTLLHLPWQDWLYTETYLERASGTTFAQRAKHIIAGGR